MIITEAFVTKNLLPGITVGHDDILTSCTKLSCGSMRANEECGKKYRQSDNFYHVTSARDSPLEHRRRKTASISSSQKGDKSMLLKSVVKMRSDTERKQISSEAGKTSIGATETTTIAGRVISIKQNTVSRS